MTAIRHRLEGSGPLLVLLHEMGGSLESWDAVAALLKADFTILRYDQRGSGASPRPQTAATLDDHLDDLETLLGNLDLPLPAFMAGVAAGAALAAGFALRRPADVRALTLCAPALSVDPTRRQYLLDRADLVSRQGMAAIADVSLENSYPPVMRRDAGAYEAYRARFLANDPVAYGDANRLLAFTDLEPQLAGLTMPCLVLSGRHDGMRPPTAGKAIAARIPAARFDTLDSGHLMPVQAGAALAQQLRGFFLASVTP